MRYIFLLLISYLFVSTSYASNIAVLDVDKVITNSIAYKDFKILWEKNNEKYQKEIESYESKMIALDKEILSKSGKISQAELQKFKDQLSNYEFTIQKLVANRKEILDRSFSNALLQIRTEILKLVEDYSIKKKISLVVPKSQIIYSSDNIEITDHILSKLNENLKKLINTNVEIAE